MESLKNKLTEEEATELLRLSHYSDVYTLPILKTLDQWREKGYIKKDIVKEAKYYAKMFIREFFEDESEIGWTDEFQLKVINLCSEAIEHLENKLKDKK